MGSSGWGKGREWCGYVGLLEPVRRWMRPLASGHLGVYVDDREMIGVDVHVSNDQTSLL